MKLTVDLTGSDLLADELGLLQDARWAVRDLLLPGLDLDTNGKDRLSTLLRIIDELWEAAWDASQTATSTE